jgi:hypothetical protein
MTNVPITCSDDYTHQGRLAVLAAVRTDHDFAAWLASVLAKVAAQLGSLGCTGARRGFWEADLLQQLTKGTVGRADEYLADYREPLP